MKQPQNKISLSKIKSTENVQSLYLFDYQKYCPFKNNWISVARDKQ